MESRSGREKPPGPPPLEEVEVISLLADHPNLIASPEADKAFWLLTDGRLRDMYSAARAGQSFLETAPVQLPQPIAKHVLSGKYSDTKDPQARLAAMTHDLKLRAEMLRHAELKKDLHAAQRGGGDPDLIRLQTLLAVAKRKGDQELVEQLLEQISTLSKPKSE
jgi:hypothetical protein